MTDLGIAPAARARPALLSKMRVFLRILERGAHLRRNLGVFQGAHFSKRVRIFEQRAHLRQGLGPAPVPFSHNVAQALASASIALFSTGRFPPVPWFSLISSFFISSDTKKGRRSADYADLNSKMCGSLSLTRITPSPRTGQNVDPALISVIREIRGLVFFLTHQDNRGGPSATKKPHPDSGHGSV